MRQMWFYLAFLLTYFVVIVRHPRLAAARAAIGRLHTLLPTCLHTVDTCLYLRAHEAHHDSRTSEHVSFRAMRCNSMGSPTDAPDVQQTAQRDVGRAYQLEYSLGQYFLASTTPDGIGFDGITTFQEMWDWLEYALLPALFPDEVWYNGQPLAKDEIGYLGLYNKLIGGFRCIQRRVIVNASCPHSPRFSDFYPSCWTDFNSGTESKEPYGPESFPEK